MPASPLLMGWLALLGALAAAPLPVLRLETTRAGVHRVSFEDLPGLTRPVASAGVGLRNGGRPVPIWLEDGGDGKLGPGDAIEWVAERPAGTRSTYDELLSENVYLLSFDTTSPARLSVPPTVRYAGQSPGARPSLRRRVHLEPDELLLRFPVDRQVPVDELPELWYWARLTHIDPEPLRIPLDLDGIARVSGAALELHLSLRGWSRPAFKPDPAWPDHRVEVRLAGKLLASAEWNQQDTVVLEVPPLDAESLPEGEVALELSVPARTPPAGGDPLVDVVLLDWLEAEYDWAGPVAEGEQLRLLSDGTATFVATTAPDLVALSARERLGAPPLVASSENGRPGFWLPQTAAGALDLVAGRSAFMAPDAIAPVPRPRLRDPAMHADYVMLVPAPFRSAVEPLVEVHRRRGLEVEVVDPEEVYAEFSDGLRHPRAIRDFLAYAHERWRGSDGTSPALRFVLLVGDASWDAHEEPAAAQRYPDAAYSPAHGAVFAHIESTDYRGPTGRARNLIPTWSFSTGDGHAADDGWFVRLGEDPLPSLAIGRLPVATLAEAQGVVAKTVRYLTSPPVGPWRGRTLWVANEQLGFQHDSDVVAGWLSGFGLQTSKIYPVPDAPAADAQEPRKIRDEFDQGELLVHFWGHGGRFVWRTGPPDWTKHRDLFNLDDLDLLAPTDRIPLVLSMTCYSAPFDHPTADSIGEKLLRLPDKGAVAVIAASWRNAPTLAMSRSLVRNLLASPTVGEALLAAKRAPGASPDFIHQYNLLGDPALVLAWPEGVPEAARTSIAAEATP